MILVTGATGNIGRPLIEALQREGARVCGVTRPALTHARWTSDHAEAFRRPS